MNGKPDSLASNTSAHIRQLAALADALGQRGGGWQPEVDNLRMAGDELERLDREVERLTRERDEAVRSAQGFQHALGLAMSRLAGSSDVRCSLYLRYDGRTYGRVSSEFRAPG